MTQQTIFRALPTAAACALCALSAFSTANLALAAEPTSPNSYKFSGTLDMGVFRDFDGSNNVGPISRSNITLSGARDLGNGNAATFLLSARLDPSTGEMNDPGSAKKPFFHGEATVGLKSDRFGAVRLGRAQDVITQHDWSYDPFYNFDSIASAAWNMWSYNYATDRTSNTYKLNTVIGGENVGTRPTGEYGRLNNGVFYDSPVVNGFQGHISGSFEKSPQALDVNGNDLAGKGNNLGAAVTYNLGAVSMMLGSTENTSGDKRALLGGKYTIGNLQVMGGVDRSTYNGGSTITANTVGVSYGMGKYRFMANVGVRNPPAAATPALEVHDRFLGLGTTYAIDAMTAVYVSVGNKSFKTAASQSAYGVGINYRF